MTSDVKLDALSEAVGHLAEQGIMGFAQLDAELKTQWSLGKLAEWIPSGRPVCEATTPFFALEADLLALQDDPSASLALPRVGLSTSREDIEKMSVEVFWRAASETYLVVVSRLGARSGAEYELVKQMRARRLAEDNYRLTRALLDEQQYLIDLVIDHAPAAIAMFDLDNRYMFATRRWTETFGLTYEPIKGRHYRDLPPYTDKSAAAAFATTSTPGMRLPEPRLLSSATGAAHWVRLDHQTWRRADGSAGGLIAFADVLTELYTAQTELRHKNAQLERTNRGLDEFATMVAHDLAAPLRAVRYGLESIRTSAARNDPAALQTALDRMDAQTERMDAMIRGLLDYARIDITRTEPAPVRPAEVMAGILAGLPGAERFTFAVETDVEEPALPITALDIILRNLLDNAIKHHDRETGHVQLVVRDAGLVWTFSLVDDGPGIDPVLHDDLFKPFRRSIAAAVKPGCGIGLAVVKRTVEAFGGTITMASDPMHQRGI